jgi:peptidoglycan/LPS O-acetylase OafA/YrhL
MTGKAELRKTDASNLPQYYPVLDALRFVLAFWVAVGHFEIIPLFGDSHTGTGLWHLFKRGWDTVVFGTPAVIVFFVISGFCIHLPFRGTGKIEVGRYYLRRYTRILIPVAAALLIYRFFGRHMVFWGEHSILWESPLWSLACEEIYYALYPGLRWIRNRIGWKLLLASTFAIGVGIAATHPHAESWHVFGALGTAMMLLPVWLLGCLLAEQAESLKVEKPFFGIWFWRFLAWLGCWLCEMLHFKLGVPYTQTMVWFGLLAYFWVRQEIAYGKGHSPNRFLVAGGAWSYSLYLVHAQGGGLYGALHLPSLGRIVDWCLVMISSLLFAYVFYILVERPSHKLARKIKLRSSRNSASPKAEIPYLPIEESGLPKEAANI